MAGPGGAASGAAAEGAASRGHDLTRQVLSLFGIAFGAILFIVVVGEWLGFFDAVAAMVAGDTVVVRPGERIPVDGTIVSGTATIPQLGALRVRAERIGAESTFGKVVRMVEEAEANRSDVQRVADRFSGYYLPVVALVAAATFIASGDALATVAVLVVACSCAFALATPIAMLASVGAAARRGLLIKGGKYIELLDRADVLLVDKTGTLTLETPTEFTAVPGLGVRATIGATVVAVTRNGNAVGHIAVADRVREEVPAALARVRELGIPTVELLTGDAEQTAARLAGDLGIAYRAELLPEDKIRVVKEYHQQGRTVVMVGDGVNDAPALAQADVGIAMGGAGTDVAVESAHVALLRDDWSLVPEVLAVAKRTLRVVRGNIGFTAAYNLVGLSLAAVGILPPVLAAAAQSLPDLGILANSSRLLRR